MKAIIHIGTEKTGTTSIQEFLYVNQVKLQEFGFYFIQSAGVRNNRAIAAYCMDENKHDGFWSSKGVSSSGLEKKQRIKEQFVLRFEEEIKNIPDTIHTVLITSEHFHSRLNTDIEVKRLKSFLNCYFSEIKIICYLREQVSLHTSRYSTSLKTGNSQSLEERTLRQCTPRNIYYNYHEMLKIWTNLFGLDSLDIALFDKNHFVNQDLLDDFSSRISPEIVGHLDSNIKVQNESLTYVGQLLLRSINRVFGGSDCSPEHKQIRLQCSSVIMEKCKGKGEILPVSLQKKLYGEFRESNEKIRRIFFPEIDSIFASSDQRYFDNTVDDSLVDTLEILFHEILSSCEK